jgi:thiol-disulfide isomerase/thioredoxin
MMKIFFSISLSLLISSHAFSQEVRTIRITDLQKTITETKTPLIVSFWATYCVPCLQEIPYFEKLVKEHEKDSVKLILVSLDLKDDYNKIKPFVLKRKFSSAIAWLNETDADYFCPRVDSSWSGAIPASLFINNQTGYRHFFEGQLTEENLKKEMTAVLRKRD